MGHEDMESATDRKRSFVNFAVVRPPGRERLDEIVKRAGRALGCTLVEKRERDHLFFACTLLGMQVELSIWHGGPLYLLRGYRPFATVDDAYIDVTPAIIDLLQEAGLGDWREPT